MHRRTVSARITASAHAGHSRRSTLASSCCICTILPCSSTTFSRRLFCPSLFSYLFVCALLCSMIVMLDYVVLLLLVCLCYCCFDCLFVWLFCPSFVVCHPRMAKPVEMSAPATPSTCEAFVCFCVFLCVDVCLNRLFHSLLLVYVVSLIFCTFAENLRSCTRRLAHRVRHPRPGDGDALAADKWGQR